MGLLLDKLKQLELSNNSQNSNQNNKSNDNQKLSKNYEACVKFPDLDSMPPELSLQILKYLNATDLCLAACVWSSLASDDILWQGLCKSTWGYASCYDLKCITDKNCSIKVENSHQLGKRSFRKLFMHLDEATLTFNSDWKKVKFIHNHLLFK
jgi:F-box protein 8